MSSSWRTWMYSVLNVLNMELNVLEMNSSVLCVDLIVRLVDYIHCYILSFTWTRMSFTWTWLTSWGFELPKPRDHDGHSTIILWKRGVGHLINRSGSAKPRWNQYRLFMVWWSGAKLVSEPVPVLELSAAETNPNYQKFTNTVRNVLNKHHTLNQQKKSADFPFGTALVPAEKSATLDSFATLTTRQRFWGLQKGKQLSQRCLKEVSPQRIKQLNIPMTDCQKCGTFLAPILSINLFHDTNPDVVNRLRIASPSVKLPLKQLKCPLSGYIASKAV